MYGYPKGLQDTYVQCGELIIWRKCTFYCKSSLFSRSITNWPPKDAIECRYKEFETVLPSINITGDGPDWSSDREGFYFSSKMLHWFGNMEVFFSLTNEKRQAEPISVNGVAIWSRTIKHEPYAKFSVIKSNRSALKQWWDFAVLKYASIHWENMDFLSLSLKP